MEDTAKKNAKASPASKKALVRAENTRRIIEAAEQVFAEKGFDGATTQAIASLAKLPKANLHYYFPTKESLYLRVLDDILAVWIGDAEIFDQSDDPETALRAYITRKIEHSFSRPRASKVWAMEIISGGQVFDTELKTSFLKWNEKKVSQLKKWIRQGKLNAVNPQHLMFSIWATTQHYADFEYQIRLINKGRPLSAKQRKEAMESVIQLFLDGVIPR